MPVVNRVAELHARKEAEERRRISFSEVARAANISRQALSSWYNNEVNAFYPDVIEALCKYYGCTIDELLVIVPAREVDADPGQWAAVEVG